jgi:folylpolyglutamate synthase/dihydrofolate synthase
MIDLGLARIRKLLPSANFAWKAIHVAGTNGKGSVCSYISSMLQAASVPYGRFTSPHLIDRWDCISCHGQPISKDHFLELEENLQRRNVKKRINATEFELLTATAFNAFSRYKVQIGVVEVGVGGAQDATNRLEHPLATVITKIGLDHQGLLGDTIEKIAEQKAGIMKPRAPCFVDATNSYEVQKALHVCASRRGAGKLELVHPDSSVYDDNLWHVLSRSDYADHQQMNITLAYEATKSALSQNRVKFDRLELARAVPDTVWPGRLQQIDLAAMVEKPQQALLDGAHNPQAAHALGRWVQSKLRSGEAGPITWLMAMSDGKDVEEIVSPLIRRGDNVVTVAFGPVDGMPWVRPVPASELLTKIRSVIEAGECRSASGVREAMETAATVADGKPLVITGSLYLVSDVLRIKRNVEQTSSR